MLIGILVFLLVVISLALLGLILIQRGKGGGLAGAFGGGGVEQAFGTRAASMAQKATAVMSVIFLVLCVWLGLLMSPSKRGAAISAPVDQTQPAGPASPEGAK